MATTVQEIMNPELFCVRPDEPASIVRSAILGLGITGAPVVDAEGVPLGMVSLRDLTTRGGATAADIMSAPAVVVSERAAIDDAAALLCERGLHRLVVVDADRHAVGMLSSVDVIRGLMGKPARRPASFPHFDAETGLVWSDDAELTLANAECAPLGGGVLVLVRGGVGVRETAVWAEPANNLRARLMDLASLPQDLPMLAQILRSGGLRFRTTEIDLDSERAHVGEVMRRIVRRANPEAV